MNCSSHAKVLLAFEKAFVEAGERGARLAAENAAKLGLAVPYSDGTSLVEVLPDGSVRNVKPLDPMTKRGNAADDEPLVFPTGLYESAVEDWGDR